LLEPGSVIPKRNLAGDTLHSDGVETLSRTKGPNKNFREVDRRGTTVGGGVWEKGHRVYFYQVAPKGTTEALQMSCQYNLVIKKINFNLRHLYGGKRKVTKVG